MRHPAPQTSLPPSTDRRWRVWVLPVYEQLRQPTSWPTLKAWARTQRIGGFLLRNCLAWLENAGAVVSTGSGDRLRWRAVS